uniref:Uncharacterized protein n=1 Tax=Populus davidiana TaxID=266767 RepID=A0A6M2ELH1_9ROSI
MLPTTRYLFNRRSQKWAFNSLRYMQDINRTVNQTCFIQKNKSVFNKQTFICNPTVNNIDINGSSSEHSTSLNFKIDIREYRYPLPRQPFSFEPQVYSSPLPMTR